MTPPLTTDDIDRMARKRAGAKLGWYAHATVYLLVNLFLYFLSANGVAAGRHPWSIYPAMGWGLGLALHGISVFALGTGSGLRERLVAREREALLRQQERGPGQNGRS
jgi:hypothetical protein